MISDFVIKFSLLFHSAEATITVTVMVGLNANPRLYVSKPWCRPIFSHSR